MQYCGDGKRFAVNCVAQSSVFVDGVGAEEPGSHDVVVGHVVAVGAGVGLGCDDEGCVRDSYPCYCCCCWGLVGRGKSI